MEIEPVEIDIAQQRSIRRRLRSGEKALHIAKDVGLPLRKIIRIAKNAGIALKRGRQKICDNPELYSKHIDSKLEAGTATDLMNWSTHLTLEEMGEALGGMSRGSVHHIMRGLTGGASKPRAPRKPLKLQRADITMDKVRESAGRCLSVMAMARELGVSESIISRRARNGSLTLPNGHLNLAEIMPDKRPDITEHCMRTLAEVSPSINVMARALHTDSATVKRRAKRFGISLPRYGRPRLAP